MLELSLHLLDIAENSVRAGAGRVDITVEELLPEDRITITIRDNGCGMDAGQLERVRSGTSPFTTRENGRGGNGIPLLKKAARAAGGKVVITSEAGRGTAVTAVFGRTAAGSIPLGDVAASVATLAQGSPETDFIFTYQYDAKKFSVSTREWITAFLDGKAEDKDLPAAVMRLLEFICDGIQKTKGRNHITMKSMEELNALRDKMRPAMGIRADDSGNTRVTVAMGTCGIAAGARPVLLALVDECAKNALDGVTVAQTGCLGICAQEPVVEIVEPGKEKVTYVKMTAAKAAEIVKNHLIGGRVMTEYTIGATKK